MTYNERTRTIELDEGSDFLADSQILAVTMLRDFASAPDAKEGIKRDWTALSEWLGTSGPLAPEHHERIATAWKAYAAMGVAPSIELQPTFDQLAKQYRAQLPNFRQLRPPETILAIFDRMLATDQEIKVKRAHDFAEDKKRLMPALDAMRKAQGVSWWRRQSRETRVWLFTFIAWPAAVLLGCLIVDPFDVGTDWSYMADSEVVRLTALAALPFFAAVARVTYLKLVP